jgi:hypothetical protein
MDPIARLAAQRAAKEAPRTEPANVAAPSTPHLEVEQIPNQSTASAPTAPDIQQPATATINPAVPNTPDIQQPATATIDAAAAVPAVTVCFILFNDNFLCYHFQVAVTTGSSSVIHPVPSIPPRPRPRPKVNKVSTIFILEPEI